MSLGSGRPKRRTLGRLPGGPDGGDGGAPSRPRLPVPAPGGGSWTGTGRRRPSAGVTGVASCGRVPTTRVSRCAVPGAETSAPSTAGAGPCPSGNVDDPRNGELRDLMFRAMDALDPADGEGPTSQGSRIFGLGG